VEERRKRRVAQQIKERACLTKKKKSWRLLYHKGSCAVPGKKKVEGKGIAWGGKEEGRQKILKEESPTKKSDLPSWRYLLYPNLGEREGSTPACSHRGKGGVHRLSLAEEEGDYRLRKKKRSYRDFVNKKEKKRLRGKAPGKTRRHAGLGEGEDQRTKKRRDFWFFYWKLFLQGKRGS